MKNNKIALAAIAALLLSASSLPARADAVADFSSASLRSVSNNSMVIEGLRVGNQYVSADMTYNPADGTIDFRIGETTYQFSLSQLPMFRGLTVDFSQVTPVVIDSTSFRLDHLMVNGQSMSVTFHVEDSTLPLRLRIQPEPGSDIDCPYFGTMPGQRSGCTDDRDCDGVPDAEDAFPDNPGETNGLQMGYRLLGFNQYCLQNNGTPPSDMSGLMFRHRR